MFAQSTNDFVDRNIKSARANLQVGNIQFSAISELNLEKEWMYYTNFLATDVDVGKPIVDLVDDATSWHTGNMILLIDPPFMQCLFTTQ